MSKTKFIVLQFLCLFMSNIALGQSTANTTPIALGIIGKRTTKLLQPKFHHIAIPKYTDAIRVQVAVNDFNKKTFNAYSKATLKNKLSIHYTDSLAVKPQFVKLQLMDLLAVQSNLKKEHNETVLHYIKNQKTARILTALSIALPEPQLSNLISAEAVFLIQLHDKKYGLALERNGTVFETLTFDQGVIFDATRSYFCWGENEKRKLVLFDIVQEGQPCAGNSHRDIRKVARYQDQYLKL